MVFKLFFSFLRSLMFQVFVLVEFNILSAFRLTFYSYSCCHFQLFRKIGSEEREEKKKDIEDGFNVNLMLNLAVFSVLVM